MRQERVRKTKRNARRKREYDWARYAGRARMHVWNSGGPINAPHERVLQLLICPFEGTNESWTVYRHETDPARDGKIVFKRWDCEADKPRFKRLVGKVSDVWDIEPTVVERQFPVAARWVKNLDNVVGSLSIPPICGAIKERDVDERYRLSFWRGDQKSEFAWHQKPPPAWRPLQQLFAQLLRSFRRFAKGKVLPSARMLLKGHSRHLVISSQL
jgi:hypothetical protein